MQGGREEKHIAEAAIARFQQQTGLRLRFGADGFLYLVDAGAKLVAEVKKWAGHASIGVLINKMEEAAAPSDGILIADYINPSMAEKLKAAEIQFLDTAGNAYLNRRPIYIYITGKKNQHRPTPAKMLGRAFQPTGLKVGYAFLTNKALINAPYRDIAKQANVALGAVGGVIQDLVEQGFLVDKKKGKARRLTNYNELLDQWAAMYPQQLRKKQLLGNFTAYDTAWWHKLDPRDYSAVWGGEIAAAQYTHYLTPKDATLYIPQECINPFLKEAQLRRPQQFEKPHINIELLEPFWPITASKNALADPILVYADLLGTSEPRNIEAAQKLRDQYIN